jgi:hypothetical protein
MVIRIALDAWLYYPVSGFAWYLQVYLEGLSSMSYLLRFLLRN